MPRKSPFGFTGRQLAEAILMTMAKGGPGFDFMPSLNDDEQRCARDDIVEALRRDTGKDIPKEDSRLIEAICKACVKLVKFNVLSSRKVRKSGATDPLPVWRSAYWITDPVLVQKLRPDLNGLAPRTRPSNEELFHCLRLAYPRSTKY